VQPAQLLGSVHGGHGRDRTARLWQCVCAQPERGISCSERRCTLGILWIILIVIVVLALLGFLGRGRFSP
jgi:hypothetical protein